MVSFLVFLQKTLWFSFLECASSTTREDMLEKCNVEDNRSYSLHIN